MNFGIQVINQCKYIKHQKNKNFGFLWKDNLFFVINRKLCLSHKLSKVSVLQGTEVIFNFKVFWNINYDKQALYCVLYPTLFIMSTPPRWGGWTYYFCFFHRPPSHLVSRHFRQQFLSYLYQIWHAGLLG